MAFRAFDFLRLRVGIDFLQDQFYLLQLQVDDVVHQTLGQPHMLLEQLKVEISIRRKRIHHIRIKVDSQQTATVIRTERNLPARIRADRAETQVGIAIRHRLTQDGVPEQHARFRAFPCIMHYFPPQIPRTDFL